MLHRVVEFIQPLAASLGGPGLVLIAFLDSSFLSFPEVPDFLLVLLVVQHPARWPDHASMTTLGSVLGCFALYFVARRGGEAMMRRRFRASTLDRAMGAIRRYGLLAVFVPSLLPPPAPFKIFVILAGISGIAPGPFGAAIVLGRGLRYLAEALLVYRYGSQAMRYIDDNLGRFSLWAAIAITVIAAAAVWWRRRRRPE